MEVSLTGEGRAPRCSRRSDSRWCGGFVGKARPDVAA